jgi:predicted extracellular nuclease
MTVASYGQYSDLFISMYAEGSSNNKFIEIYNGTGSSIDLILLTG